jgi:hypothetical protein
VSNPLPPLVAERLRALRERPIDPTEKGFGPLTANGGGVTAARLAAARPALHTAGFAVTASRTRSDEMIMPNERGTCFG